MERLFAKIKRETLNPDENKKILSALQDFVDENPMQNIKSPYFNSWFVFKQKTIIIPAVVALILILTTGTVFAAKNSLPGNILYPIKKLDEKVQLMTAVGPKAQAEVHASQAISRLQEAEQIVTSGGQLNTDTGQQIKNDFKSQTQDATDHIDELKNGGHTEQADKIQFDFNKSLTEHEKAITNLLTNTNIQTQNKEQLSQVYSNIHSQLEKSKNQNHSDKGKENDD